MQQPRIFFAVALHEKYALPTDSLYTPIQAGAAIHPPLGLMRDNTGENISAKNGSYCELTVLYWMAHNVDADWYGLCHYRRYFSLRRTGCPQKRILTRTQLLPLLDTADIFLPKKRHYWLETNFTQYAHAPVHQFVVIRLVARGAAQFWNATDFGKRDPDLGYENALQIQAGNIHVHTLC